MNQSYRLVWSAVRGAWAVVSELTKSHAKSVVMASVVIAAVVPMQVQAVLISSGDLSVQDLKVGHLASTGVTEFEVGGTFGMASTNFAVLRASGVGSMVDLGGGTYHLSTASGSEAAIESLGDLGKGGIDFSKANKVILTTGQRAGLEASKGGHIQLSELDLTHSHSSGMANVASILSQDEGSVITLRKAKIENSTSGVGIESLNGGEIIINELAYASTNAHSGLLLTGTKNSQMTIGSLTGAQSRISNGNGNLITVNAKAATLMLNHIEVTGNAANTTKLMHMTVVTRQRPIGL